MKFSGITVTAAVLAFAGYAIAQTEKTPENQAAPDWITTSNKPCKVWNPEPQPNESVTWSGTCKDGLASGKGILFWTEDGKPDVEFDGEYANGKRNGHGVVISPDGNMFEGDWVDDKLITNARDSI